MKALNIPVGISNFEKIRNNGFYYVDKTGLIEELLKTEAEVTLITRPRRFGKTLGMSMLESFFDIRKNSRKLFEGLEIARQSELCSKWMNQCPTVSVSFRQADGLRQQFPCPPEQPLAVDCRAALIKGILSGIQHRADGCLHRLWQVREGLSLWRHHCREQSVVYRLQQMPYVYQVCG